MGNWVECGLFEAELGCEKARKRLSEGFVPKRGLSGFELESMRWSTGSRRERAAVLCTAMRVKFGRKERVGGKREHEVERTISNFALLGIMKDE